MDAIRMGNDWILNVKERGCWMRKWIGLGVVVILIVGALLVPVVFLMYVNESSDRIFR
jgi:uncharacterized membrane protein YukC